MKLVDFQVRVKEGTDGTGAKVRVRIDSRDASEIWSSVGVSENIMRRAGRRLLTVFNINCLKRENNGTK